MASSSTGASTGLRARLPNWKQGSKEELAKNQGQSYLFSKLSFTVDLHPRMAAAFAGFGNHLSQQYHPRKYPVQLPS